MKHSGDILNTEAQMNLPFNHHKKRVSRFSAHRLMALFALVAISMVTSISFSITSWSIFSTQTHAKALTHNASKQKSNDQLITVPQQFVTPPTSTSIDLLSSNLSSYLSALGSNVGVEIYDITNQRSYAYNNTAQFLTASSIKVPIMLTFFSMTESQGREPDDNEMNLLTAMIEHSDNDAASALYGEINGATGIANYLQQIGVNGLAPDSDAWGYSLITPQAMIDLLTQLYNGTILTANDRATALDLMQHVEADQQWGVGDTAPSGATVSMKNGWVPGPDGLWSVNTSGIVSTGGETYIISVYTQEQQSLADGQAIVQYVCSTVASALV